MFSGCKESDPCHEIGLPILAQCSISIPPENVRKPWFSGGIEMEHWAKMG